MKISKNSLKAIGIASAATAITGAVAAAVSACKKKDKTKSNSEYLRLLSQYPFWKNTPSTAVPEYNTYYHVHAFLDACALKKREGGCAERKSA